MVNTIFKRMFFFRKLDRQNAKYYFALALAILGLIYLSSVNNPPKTPLMKLFEKKYINNNSYSPATQKSLAIKDYILGCCEFRDDAIDMLIKNGFEIAQIDNPEEVEKLNSDYRQTKEFWANKYEDYIPQDYDGFVRAKKANVLPTQSMLFSSEYRISLFLKNNKVVWVIARIDTTLP